MPWWVQDVRGRFLPRDPPVALPQIARKAGTGAGHRIRIEVSSSNFPRFDRNPNTGDPFADATGLRKAAQTVYHDARRPSCLLLPVLRD